MSVQLSQKLFESLLNQKFHAYFNEEHQYELELIEVKPGKKIESLDIEPFSLMFRTARTNPPISQMTVRLQNEATGEISLFLIPRIPDKEGIYYEAVFS